MPRTNDEVEAILTEYAELLAISGGDPYKPRSYEKAARSIVRILVLIPTTPR